MRNTPQDRTAVDAPPPYDGMNGLNLRGPSDLHRIVIGVDFGTTATGVSFISTEGARTKIVNDVTCVDDWPGPGRGGDASWKCPSRIAYASDNNLTSNDWGYGVLPGSKAYTWFKLLLDQQQATKFDDPGLIITEGQGVLSKPFGKSAVDLCADFLAEVATFAYKSIGRRVTPEVLKATPLDFWFTVPAMWSDRAKAHTLSAAQKAAKIARIECHPDSQVFLIQEPEAAAVATLSFLTEGAYSQLVKVGDGILVCDCGGGTVDLTSYEITAITPKLSFKELIMGVGGKCGSTYIDREFIRWMEATFETEYTSLPWVLRGPASPLMKAFEGAKRDFGKSNDTSRPFKLQVYLRNFKKSFHYDPDYSELKIGHHEMQRMFDPVVDKVKMLLQSQIQLEADTTGVSTIRTVFLVGGFGDSAYLHSVLQTWCRQRRIRLLCPEHPQSSIVRGAALSGLLNIRPSTRRCRRHYGFSVHQTFDPLIHREEDKFFWVWNGEERARGNMKWELNKGAVVGPETEISFNLHSTLSDRQLEEPRYVNVYCSDLDEPPARVGDPGVKLLATMKRDFQDVDLDRFPAKSKGSQQLHYIPCQYTISFGHRQGVLNFTCSTDDQDIGAISVSFEGDQSEEDPKADECEDGASPPCQMQ